MDLVVASCPSLPPKILAIDELRPKLRPKHTTPGIPLKYSGAAACFLLGQVDRMFVIIEVFSPCHALTDECVVHMYKSGPP
jgi:hypothetical protein